ncbi:cytochrome c [Halobacillus fulvus]|nr:cytochrome c [Halobacillus fulvus]
MKKWLSALFLVLILVLGACGGGGDDGATDDGGTTEEPADEGMEDGSTEDGMDEGGEGEDSGGEVDTAAAEQAYQANCASCHGGDMEGGVGPALQGVGSKYSADEIVDIIQNGMGQMPAQEGVSEEDAQTIADWLVSME